MTFVSGFILASFSTNPGAVAFSNVNFLVTVKEVDEVGMTGFSLDCKRLGAKVILLLPAMILREAHKSYILNQVSAGLGFYCPISQTQKEH